VQALTTQIDLARMAPAQLVVFIEKLLCVHLWRKVKAFYRGHDEPCASLFRIEVSRTLA